MRQASQQGPHRQAPKRLTYRCQRIITSPGRAVSAASMAGDERRPHLSSLHRYIQAEHPTVHPYQGDARVNHRPDRPQAPITAVFEAAPDR